MQYNIRIRLGCLLALVLAFVLVGCGYNGMPSPSPGGSSSAGSTPTSTPATRQPAPTTPPVSPAGAVRLELDKTRYATNETVNVTILNGSAKNISTTDHQSDCTMLMLEWQSSTGWVMVGRCRTMLLSRMYTLKPGSTTLQRLSPAFSAPGTSTAALWRPGTYRVTLFYHSAPDQDSVQGQENVSVEFTVQ